MPERRRPGLWKTLVAAAQTAIDSVADGVEVLADRAEALADGLRSLGRGKPPPPPLDPRFAGMDPALAAYVAARDPVWFSWDVQGGESMVVGSVPSAVGEDRASTTEPAAVDADDPAPWATPQISQDRHPRRQKPSAAELPGGRPVPMPRVGFPQRRKAPDAAAASARPTPRPDAVPSWRPAAPGPADSTVPPRGSAERDEATPTDSETAPPRPAATPAEPPPSPSDQAASRVAASPAATKTDPIAPSAGVDRSTPTRMQPRPAPDDTIIDARSRPSVAAPRGIPEAAPADAPRARWDASRSAPRPPFEPPRRLPRPPSRAPFPPAARSDLPTPVPNDSRWSAPPRQDATRPSTIAAPATPAPWPELPPPRWSTPAPDHGGLAAWAGPAASEVLVDEQRST